eukprot:2415798-Amphidinium_carterae.1
MCEEANSEPIRVAHVGYVIPVLGWSSYMQSGMHRRQEHTGGGINAAASIIWQPLHRGRGIDPLWLWRRAFCNRMYQKGFLPEMS